MRKIFNFHEEHISAKAHRLLYICVLGPSLCSRTLTLVQAQWKSDSGSLYYGTELLARSQSVAAHRCRSTPGVQLQRFNFSLQSLLASWQTVHRVVVLPHIWLLIWEGEIIEKCQNDATVTVRCNKLYARVLFAGIGVDERCKHTKVHVHQSASIFNFFKFEFFAIQEPSQTTVLEPDGCNWLTAGL